MKTPLNVYRRPLLVAAFLAATVSLAIGANAALNKRAMDAASAVATEQGIAAKKPARLALVIGNGHYPDAGDPLTQPINDARALSGALRHDGFDVDVIEDASRDDMTRAVERLKGKITPDSVVMLFFGGYGVQAGRESYMIPVDATIWKEADVRRTGVSVEGVLEAMKEKGARAKLVVLDASRRNPYERRFRQYQPWPGADQRARQRADPDLGDAGQGGRGLPGQALACWSASCSARSMPGWSAPKPPSTRPASRSPRRPTASRCPRCRPRCWKTSASAATVSRVIP